MQQVTIRIIVAHTITAAQKTALERGIAGFASYGVKIERACMLEPQAFKGIRHGPLLKKIIAGAQPVPLRPRAGNVLADILLGRAFFGFGVTTAALVCEDQQKILGAGHRLTGAVLSVKRFMELPVEQQLRAIEVATRHEAGHLFIPNHCTDTRCVMQANEHVQDFLATHVERNLTLCATCSATVAHAIDSMQRC